MPPVTRIALELPGWVVDEIDWSHSYASDEEKMGLAILLADLNIRHGTGGPFGAAIFDEASGRLLAAGMNRVVPSCCAAAHAEVVAIMAAGAATESFDLGAEGQPARTLAASSQPCTMCCGAVVWSGVRRLLYGADKNDVQTLTGFDEGPVIAEWERQLAERGIEVRGPLLREEARRSLARYREAGGVIYNGRSGGEAQVAEKSDLPFASSPLK